MEEARNAMMRSSREERRNFWRSHMEKAGQEGIPIRRYCCKHELSEASFHYWRRRLRQGTTESEGQALVHSSPFTRIRFSGEPFSNPIRMALGQGVVLFIDSEPSAVKDPQAVVTITPSQFTRFQSKCTRRFH